MYAKAAKILREKDTFVPMERKIDGVKAQLSAQDTRNVLVSAAVIHSS
jgi:hypothetical protein